ncbi:MAG: protein phosphatase 2C domain-containing protein [Ottowia sp.]|nr:protein phosphatase 2C domain-containing protein [Ottowia sp.]
MFQGFETCGLECSTPHSGSSAHQQLFCVSGTPDKAGDFNIVMHYTYTGWIDGLPCLRRTFRFTITPDPRDLWQNIPVPADIEYPTPDSEAQYIPASPQQQGGAIRNLVAASQRGRSHAHHGKPRDDAFALLVDQHTNWHIMAVSDGAGSAQFSRMGAHLACTKAVRNCLVQLRELEKDKGAIACIQDFVARKGASQLGQVSQAMNSVLHAAAASAYKAIHKEAETTGRVIHEYAATLLLAICKKFSSGWFIATFGVGDGAMAVLRAADNASEADGAFDAKLLAEADEGEFSGQTRFLTMKEVFNDRPRIHIAAVADFTAIVLMSDGVSDAKFETGAKLRSPQKWRALWLDVWQSALSQPAEPERALLEWLNFWSTGNHDDRTIAILY